MYMLLLHECVSRICIFAKTVVVAKDRHCEVSRCLRLEFTKLANSPKMAFCEDEWYHMHCVVVESHCIILIDLVDDVHGCMSFQVF